MPDFDTLLYEGKLDKEVIADCSNFLHQAVGGETMDRKIGMWAWLLYYMLLMSWMAQSVDGEPEAIIKWVVQQCQHSARETKNTHSTVRRFVYALSKIMPEGEMAGSHVTERAETSVYWHNFRNVRQTSHSALLFTKIGQRPTRLPLKNSGRMQGGKRTIGWTDPV